MTQATTPTAADVDIDVDAAVTVTELTDMAAIGEAAALLDSVWSVTGIIPTNLIRAIEGAGGYVSGAYVRGQMVGASVGFRGAVSYGDRVRPSLHSHVTGVREPARGIGRLLKAHQLAWARDHGIELITWTFDPLVSRNAYFNLHKLGVHCRRYLLDHYGPMDDAFNAGDETDRLEALWPVDVGVRPASTASDDNVSMVLAAGADGRPTPVSSELIGGAVIGIQVPPDIEELRQRAPDVAAEWRTAVRETMAPLMAGGHWITGMRRDGTYLLTRRG